MNTEIEYRTKVDETLIDRLEKVALEACKKVRAISGQQGGVATELRAKFLAAVADIKEVRIEMISLEHGAFVLERGILRLQREPVLVIMDQVLTDIETRDRSSRRPLAADEIRTLQDGVFLGYFLHEVRHRTQGIGRYADVQKVKAIAGRQRVSELDLLADRDAAMAYSAIVTPDLNDRAAFLEGFKKALYFSHLYYFRAFKFPADRPDKLARAATTIIMLARFAASDEPGFEVEHERLPLDAALHVTLDPGERRLALFRVEPSQELIQVAEGGSVPIVMKHLKDGDFDAALVAAVGLLIQLRLAPLRVLD